MGNKQFTQKRGAFAGSLGLAFATCTGHAIGPIEVGRSAPKRCSEKIRLLHDG